MSGTLVLMGTGVLAGTNQNLKILDTAGYEEILEVGYRWVQGTEEISKDWYRWVPGTEKISTIGYPWVLSTGQIFNEADRCPSG